MTTLTIMRILPREVDPMVYKMSLEDPGGISFAGIGGLGEQVRELREVRFPTSSQSPFHPLIPTRNAGDRTTVKEPRALPPRGHQTAEGRPSLRPTRDGQDAPRPGCRRDARHQVPQGRLLRYRRQVHRRVCTRRA